MLDDLDILKGIQAMAQTDRQTHLYFVNTTVKDGKNMKEKTILGVG